MLSSSTKKFPGTTLLLLASNAITLYQRATGAVLDNNTGLLRLTPAQFANLQSLFFTTNGVSLRLDIVLDLNSLDECRSLMN